MKDTVHKTVLLNETIDGLNITKGDVVVDGTLGGGGHTAEIFKRFPKEVKVIGIDADPSAIERALKRIGNNPNFKSFCGNFRNLDEAISENGFEKVNGFLFDLGLSSDQLDVSGRGFTFKKDEPLLMTFGKDGITAGEIINNWSEETLETIIKSYGEESFARKIAKAIIEARVDYEIETTGELVGIIESAVPAWYRNRNVHPATKTFQALRIAVNDEIGALEEGLAKAFERLQKGGRIAVISFHSLEDRVVKNFFRDLKTEGLGKLINKKPIVPTRDEVVENSRSRSAKLRIIEKI
jgi:16S rRNA (cytosine1402-N4)-methyltransferase